ncbi:hypothetical protein [Roseateles sp. P5_E7]
MPDHIRLLAPPPGEDLRRYFDERVAGGGLEAALDLSVVEFDELAQRTGVTVTRVDASDAGIAVHYTVAWTSFHACDDRTFGGAHARVLHGCSEGHEWVFERPEPLPIHRDTLDEF